MALSLRAVTFDFWSTLVDGTVTPERSLERLARLHAAITREGFACSLEDLEDARERVEAHLTGPQLGTYEDVGPPGRWAAVARELGIPDGLIPFEVIERAYEDITLSPLPALMPHASEAVAQVRQAGYRTGVICNTGMAGGRTLREVLRRHALFDCFDALVFSNEHGYAKPHPSIFAHALDLLGGVVPREALHVGDVEELDVEGARRAGMHTALYAPDARGELRTDADFVVRDWREFGSQLAALTESAQSPLG